MVRSTLRLVESRRNMRSPTRLIALGTRIVFFIVGITACGKVSFVSPLDRPRPGESMRLYPLSLAEKNQSNPRTVLFFKISDSGQDRKIRSFDIEFYDQDFGKSQQLNVVAEFIDVRLSKIKGENLADVSDIQISIRQ